MCVVAAPSGTPLARLPLQARGMAGCQPARSPAGCWLWDSRDEPGLQGIQRVTPPCTASVAVQLLIAAGTGSPLRILLNPVAAMPPHSLAPLLPWPVEVALSLNSWHCLNLIQTHAVFTVAISPAVPRCSADLIYKHAPSALLVDLLCMLCPVDLVTPFVCTAHHDFPAPAHVRSCFLMNPSALHPALLSVSAIPLRSQLLCCSSFTPLIPTISVT